MSHPYHLPAKEIGLLFPLLCAPFWRLCCTLQSSAVTGGHPHGATVYTGDTGKLEPVLQVLQRCAIKDPKRATLLRAKGPSCLTLCCHSDLQNFQSHILREGVYERVRY